ncbi:signal peptidase II [uncultured Paracoccus sp.]|uniref:signal peptidase II n=1 Tax=uncultured Paracoccus sp. TaxID=189685 RepID=UPI00260CBC60|nr:signal peptidase II [uncultured Paracoccus sp.]
MRRWHIPLIGLLALALDQITKAAALVTLTQGVPLAILPGFNLSLGFNTGASFGMLSGMMRDTPLAMAALTGAITLGLAVLALRVRTPWEAAGFALVIGGSLGNVVDRLRRGAVTDFLDVYWRDWHWPAFNMADVAISIGAAMIVITALPAFRKRYGDA